MSIRCICSANGVFCVWITSLAYSLCLCKYSQIKKTILSMKSFVFQAVKQRVLNLHCVSRIFSLCFLHTCGLLCYSQQPADEEASLGVHQRKNGYRILTIEFHSTIKKNETMTLGKKTVWNWKSLR